MKTARNILVFMLCRSWVYYALAAGVVLSSVQTTRLQLRKMDELKSTLDYPRSFSRGEAPFDRLGFRRAIRYYKRLGEIAPAVSRVMPLDAAATISRSREMVAFCYYHLGDYKKSLRFYQEALRLKPEFRWLHYNLGVVHYRLGDDEAAARELSQAMPDPTSLAAYFTPLGTTWWKRPGLKASFQKLALTAASEVSRRVAKLTVLIEDRRAGEKISPEEEQGLLKPVFHPQTHFIPIGFEEILIGNGR